MKELTASFYVRICTSFVLPFRPFGHTGVSTVRVLWNWPTNAEFSPELAEIVAGVKRRRRTSARKEWPLHSTLGL